MRTHLIIVTKEKKELEKNLLKRERLESGEKKIGKNQSEGTEKVKTL